jgi:gluconolactonase
MVMKVKFERFSPVFDEIFPTNELCVLANGFEFSEGPVWDIKKECLYFTDYRVNRIYKWSKSEGAILYRENSNRTIGMAMDADGRLISAEGSARRIAYLDSEKSTPIVSSYKGKQINSPNDVVVSQNGEIFFTDPYSEMMMMSKDLAFNGIYRVKPNGEDLHLIDDSFLRPNGLAFSPDESILYVNDTKRQHIIAFGMRKNGSVTKLGVFASVDEKYGTGVVDGMKVDIKGNLYVTGPGGMWVFGPDGKPIAVVYVPEKVGNLCFGDQDGETLFIAASTSLYALAVGVPGVLPYRKP